MGIKKLGPNRYRVLWHDERGHMHRHILRSTKEEAEAFLAKRKLQVAGIKAGDEVHDPNPEKLELGELAAKYSKGRSKRDANVIANHIAKKALGAVKLERVTPAMITKHLEELQPVPPKEGRRPRAVVLSARSRNHVRKHLVQIFRFALEHGLFVGANPAHAVKQKKVKKKPLVTLTREEAARLVNAREHPWRGILAVSLHGLRKGEIWGLDVADVDLARNELRVRRSHSEDMTKNGRERVVPIFPTMRGPIAEAVAIAKAEKHAVLFAGRKGKRRHPEGAVEVPFRASLKAAKIERHLRFHDMRHTAATLMLQAKVPIERVSKILGHSSIAITVDLYGHLIVDDLHQAVANVTFDLPAPRAVGA